MKIIIEVNVIVVKKILDKFNGPMQADPEFFRAWGKIFFMGPQLLHTQKIQYRNRKSVCIDMQNH